MIENVEIKKARKLFVEKGIVNRSVVPNKIIYSWVRSKLHHISVEILDSPKMTKQIDLSLISKKTSSIINYMRKIRVDYSDIFLLDSEGNKIFSSAYNRLSLFEFTNFSEEFIGTSAAGISIISNENSKVIGYEHYNLLLTNLITESIIIDVDNESEKKMILVTTPLMNESDHYELISRLKSDLSIQKLSNDINSETAEEVAETIINEDSNIAKNPVNTTKNSKENKETIRKVNHDKTSSMNECKVFTLSIVEENTIREALIHFSWNMKETALALGIGRSTLYRKLKQYKIEK